MKSKWNEDQLKAIESVDNNTLVSASAGSGKTAVTIERIIRIIKKKTAPVKRIVMLAFPMRSRRNSKKGYLRSLSRL